MTSDFDKAALDYHRYPKPGKLEISATKNMLNQRDLALAYSPGVAAACLAAKDDPAQAGAFARDTSARVLNDVIDGVDIFLGLSAPNVISGEQVARMAARPFILALANPEPEIHPDEVKRVRDDAIMATGRSDFPNQVNNVLCFPFLFRGALDVGAREINQEMQVACVDALANLALLEASDVVAAAYGGKPLRFGVDYLIPKPFDPRLITEIPPAVARAAMDSGVATRPIVDFDRYVEQLSQTVYKSGLVMKPVFERVGTDPQRVVLAEGASDRVLNATQMLVDEHLCYPVLLGNREAIANRIDALGLRLQEGAGFDIIDPRDNPQFDRHVAEYLQVMGRLGVSPSFARNVVQNQTTVLGALLVRCGDADTGVQFALDLMLFNM